MNAPDIVARFWLHEHRDSDVLAVDSCAVIRSLNLLHPHIPTLSVFTSSLDYFYFASGGVFYCEVPSFDLPPTVTLIYLVGIDPLSPCSLSTSVTTRYVDSYVILEHALTQYKKTSFESSVELSAM